MRRYLLDTTSSPLCRNNRPRAVSLIRPWMERHEAATSVLGYGEVVEYLRPRSDFERRHSALRTLLREIYPYFLTDRILERYADIRLRLRRPHGTGLIGDVDTLIAATALERNLTIVTADSDFERVPGLKVMQIPKGQLSSDQTNGG